MTAMVLAFSAALDDVARAKSRIAAERERWEALRLDCIAQYTPKRFEERWLRQGRFVLIGYRYLDPRERIDLLRNLLGRVSSDTAWRDALEVALRAELQAFIAASLAWPTSVPLTD